MQEHTVWTVFLQQIFKPPALHQNTGQSWIGRFRSASDPRGRRRGDQLLRQKNRDARASYDRLRGLNPECADDLCADMVQIDLCQALGLLKTAHRMAKMAGNWPPPFAPSFILTGKKTGWETKMSNETKKTPLRSQLWFDNPENREMTALYIERYVNYGLTREELQSGKPIIAHRADGIGPVAVQPPPHRTRQAHARRHRSPMAACRFEVPGASDPGNRQAADGHARPQPRLSGAGGIALRLPARRRGADDRLRQDHTGAADGGRHRQYSGDRVFGRTDAERLAFPWRAHRLGHHRLESPRAACRAGKIDDEQFMDW
jgi:hypothetical protein